MTRVKISTMRSLGTFCILALSTCFAGMFIASNGIRRVAANPEPPVLNAPTPNPSINGTLFLTWTASSGAISYQLYSCRHPITTLNASVNVVDSFATTKGNDTEPDNGTYYYVVTAENASGISPISNCVSGVVSIPPQQIMSAPPQMWNWTWAGLDSSNTQVESVAVDQNGSSYLAVNSHSDPAYIFKISPGGNSLWNNSFIGTSSGVAVDRNGNAYIAGYIYNSSIGKDQAFLGKYATNGTQLWNRTWNDTNNEYGSGVAVDLKGNAFVVGHSNVGYAILLKYGVKGKLLWKRTWNATGSDYGSAVAVDRNGDPYIAGNTGVTISSAFIAKYLANGTSLWNETQSGSYPVGGNGVAVDAGGNAFLVGYTENASTNSRAFVDKYSAGGTLLWSQSWFSSANDIGCGVTVDARGNPTLVGSTYPSDNERDDAFLAKFTTSGSSIWNLTWGYIDYYDDGYAITTDEAGNTYIAGASGLMGGFLVKYGYVPAAPILNAITPSTTGTLSLSWSATSWTTSYDLYLYTSWITSLNDSVTLIGTFTSTSANDTGLTSGAYYYVVVAENGNWSSPLSNCVRGVVSISSTPGLPGFDGTWLVVFASIGTASLALKNRDKFVAKH